MKGRIEQFGKNPVDGKWRVTFTVDGDFKLLYDQFKNVDVNLEVKKWFPRKTDAANRYMWVLCDKIATKQRITKNEVYRQAIRETGGTADVLCMRDESVEGFRKTWEKNGIGWQVDTFPSKISGCTNVIVYYGSSTFDTKQEADLIQNLMYDAEALGINTDTPEREAYWEYLKDKGFKGSVYAGKEKYKYFS